MATMTLVPTSVHRHLPAPVKNSVPIWKSECFTFLLVIRHEVRPDPGRTTSKELPMVVNFRASIVPPILTDIQTG